MINFMKFKKLLLVLTIGILAACSKSDEVRYNNPYLADINVALQLDLSLPEYNDLQFPGSKWVTYNYGIKGISVYCLNPDTYIAFELTDPNHVPQNCSRLQLNGTEASCSCDDNKYNIITGQSVQGQTEFTLKPYRAVKVGNALEITSF